MKKAVLFGIAICVITLSAISTNLIFAEENKTLNGNAAEGVVTAADVKKEEIKAIEEKTQETKEILVEKEKSAGAVKQEAEALVCFELRTMIHMIFEDDGQNPYEFI